MASGDAKKFFSHVKQVLQRVTVIPELTDDEGTYSDDLSKANCLNRFFSDVFTVSNGLTPRFEMQTQFLIVNVDFTPNTVLKALGKLSTSYSSGLDNIPSIVMKKCMVPLAEPLSMLYNACMESESLPDEWLCANVTPIYKGAGSPKLPGNYRPVSITSVPCKVMESSIKDVNLKHLLDNKLLSWRQHGFLPKRSTLAELLECLNYWMNAIDQGEHVDVVYIDLRKAFDSVDHEKLLQKCAAYGIGGKLLAVIRAFLSNRWQRVKVGDTFSDWSRVTSGVPQGSVLGPLLFLIYINDLPGVIKASQIQLYADDAKIFLARDRLAPTAAGLQRDLTSLQLWCREWQMAINAGKCSVLQIALRGVIPARYTLGDEVVPIETVVKDLGVLVSGRLTFSDHCYAIAGRASARIGLICRAFRSRDMKFMIGMYVTFVRPILEYNCEIWNPLYLGDLDKIEKVQRRFTKRIKGLFHFYYEERLEICNLESLELRRIKRDLVLTYKIINSLIDLRFADYFKFAPDVGRNMRNNNARKLYPCHARVDATVNYFANRVVNVWNALPIDVTSMYLFGHFQKAFE